MVNLTKMTKYDLILEGLSRVNEPIYSGLKKIGNSKEFTKLKCFVNTKFKHLEVGYRVHKIKKDTFVLDLDFLGGNPDLDAHVEFIVRCACSYEEIREGFGNLSVDANTIFVEYLEAPVTSLLNFKPVRIKCDVPVLKDEKFSLNGFNWEGVILNACNVVLDNVLLKNADIDKKISKATGNARGFSTVSDYLTM